MKNVLFNILSKLCLIQFKLSELRFKEKIIKNCPEMSLFVLKFVKHIMIAGVHVKLNVQLLSKHFQLNSYKVGNLKSYNFGKHKSDNFYFSRHKFHRSNIFPTEKRPAGSF